MGNEDRIRLVAVVLGLLSVLAACSSFGYKTKYGMYKAPTAAGQDAIVTFDAQGRTARLGWASGAKTDSLPATVSWNGGRIVLDLGLGLQIDGRVTGNNRFQLSYPQYTDGEPELGEPIRTLNFTLASIG